MTEPLSVRLAAAKRLLQRDRASLYDSERRPHDGSVSADAAGWIAEYDEAIAAVSEAVEIAEQL